MMKLIPFSKLVILGLQVQTTAITNFNINRFINSGHTPSENRLHNENSSLQNTHKPDKKVLTLFLIQPTQIKPLISVVSTDIVDEICMNNSALSRKSINNNNFQKPTSAKCYLLHYCNHFKQVSFTDKEPLLHVLKIIII